MKDRGLHGNDNPPNYLSHSKFRNKQEISKDSSILSLLIRELIKDLITEGVSCHFQSFSSRLGKLSIIFSLVITFHVMINMLPIVGLEIAGNYYLSHFEGQVVYPPLLIVDIMELL